MNCQPPEPQAMQFLTYINTHGYSSYFQLQAPLSPPVHPLCPNSFARRVFSTVSKLIPLILHTSRSLNWDALPSLDTQPLRLEISIVITSSRKPLQAELPGHPMLAPSQCSIITSYLACLFQPMTNLGRGWVLSTFVITCHHTWYRAAHPVWNEWMLKLTKKREGPPKTAGPLKAEVTKWQLLILHQ